MYCVKKLSTDTYWVGGSDRRLALFENIYPVERGISYNSYMVVDEKTVLLDTVDLSVSKVFFENVTHVLGGRPLDYVIVNHMEPDHCESLGRLLTFYPTTQVVGNEKTIAMIRQFFDIEVESSAIVVGEGDTLCTGTHTFSFHMAPMVHWPEAMVTYDEADHVLYSADAFGSFGALSGNLSADEVDFACDWLPDARRYYTNIVGKYGAQVKTLLDKAQTLEIDTICPLHGPVWRENIPWFLNYYRLWSAYEPEERGVMIAYASIYGNTQNAVDRLAARLGDLGVREIAMFDVSRTHHSEILAQAFRFSHLVFACPTYNAGLFPPMETLLLELKAHNLQKRTVALIENGTWAPVAAGRMKQIFESMKDMRILSDTLTVRSALRFEQGRPIEAMAQAIAGEVLDGAV